ncbi:MAG TPA: PIN domain-containing protein [Polyangiaceae bacterium]|nr:PIN domain-containing protein [Polyangiaceae bacterium]
MNVLVDTSVWSLALRRARRIDDAVPRELAELIREGRVVMIGPVRQELLSGIKSKPQFEQLRDHLRAFPDLELESIDYEEAASAYNRCRERGIQGSNTDFLICALAIRRDLAIFTTDGDFKHFARALRFELYQVRP